MLVKVKVKRGMECAGLAMVFTSRVAIFDAATTAPSDTAANIPYLII